MTDQVHAPTADTPRPRKPPKAVPTLPRDALLRRYVGDRRFALTLPRAVALQILHPVIGAALATHTRTRLWEHKRRAVSSMITIAYSDRDLRTVIRFGHEHVKGRDDTGTRYHALRPDVFFFQHATYVDSLVTAINTFARPLTPDEHEQLYAECRIWYARYGVSARHEPATWSEFTDYFADACAKAQVLAPDAWIPARLPPYAVRALLTDRARELLDVELRPGDKAALRRYAATVRASSALAPRRIRYLPQAR